MKKYVFQSGDSFIKLKVDRTNRKAEICSVTTNYRFTPIPFWKLFGSPVKTLSGFKPPTKEDSIKEMEEYSKLSDEEFLAKLKKDFLGLGYVFKNASN